MGTDNPCHNKLGKLDVHLGQQLVSYVKQDPPPTQVRSIPVSVRQALEDSYQAGSECQQAISDLAWIAFFFLLRPGEYCKGFIDKTNHPLRIKNIQFFLKKQLFNAASASPHTRTRADFSVPSLQKKRTGSNENILGMI